MSSRLNRTVAVFGYLLVVVGLIAVVVRERSTFGDAWRHILDAKPALLAGAFLLLVVGYGLLAVVAWTWTSRHITGVGGANGAAAWLGASVAKYVPGFIWHPVSTVERLQRGGASVGGATLVLLVDVAAWITSALLVGAAALPALLATEGGAPMWLLLGIPAVVALHPGVFAFGLRVLARVFRRPMPEARLDWSLIGRVVGVHALGWLFMGAALTVLLASLDAHPPIGLTIASAALSWVAGYLFLISPAGLGVREATLVALLATQMPVEVAVGAALVWRIGFVAIDFLSFCASLPLSRLAGQPLRARPFADRE